MTYWRGKRSVSDAIVINGKSGLAYNIEDQAFYYPYARDTINIFCEFATI
jgi:hypothetical protein